MGMGDLSDYEDELDDLDEDLNADERVTMRMLDQRVARDDELDDSDNEEEGMNGARPHGANKRKNIMDYQNPNSVADDIEVDSKIETPERGNDEKAEAPSAEPKTDVEDVVMEENDQSTTVAETSENGPTAAPYRSAIPAVDNDGDVDMEQAVPEPLVQVPTPTSEVHSPAPHAADADAAGSAAAAAAPTSAPTATEVSLPSQDPVEAKQEGEEERQNEDVAAEESTEIAQHSQS